MKKMIVWGLPFLAALAQDTNAQSVKNPELLFRVRFIST